MNRKITKRVIFHHSLSDFGDADLIRSWHMERGFSDIGYHFVIPKTGNCQIGRAVDLIGAHSKRKNSDSVGICLIGDLNKTHVTNSQMVECQLLYKQLCKKYGQLAIEFHHELCPGINLDRVRFVEMLREVIYQFNP